MNDPRSRPPPEMRRQASPDLPQAVPQEVPQAVPQAVPDEVPDEVPHESAALHVGGTARYVDDLAEPIGTLHAAIGHAGLAHFAFANRPVHRDGFDLVHRVDEALVAQEAQHQPLGLGTQRHQGHDFLPVYVQR